MKLDSKTILNFIREKSYHPMKVKELSQALGISQPDYRKFRHLIKFLLFAILALLLAAAGVYGVMSYNVSQRSSEMGVRLAVGARRSDILGLVLREGAALTLAGVGLGLLGGFWLTRLLSSLLFAVDPRDASTFVLAPIGTVLVALAACLLPALRATRVDPLQTLRHP